MLDRTRLAKLLALTGSDNDAEALAAVRKANEMVRGHNMTWAEVVTVDTQPLINIMVQRRSGMGMAQPASGKVDGEDKDWLPPHLNDASIIDPMFRAIFAQPRTGSEEFWQFMDSVHNSWQQKGSLTSGQYNALRRCYNRTRAARA